MFGLKLVRSVLDDIRTIKNGVRELQETTASLQGRSSQLASNLDIAINEIEFVRRRTNAYLGNGTTLAYLTDQSPIFVDPSDAGPATNILNGGLYEADNLDIVMSFVRPDTVFLDLGANVGIFSLQVGRRVTGAGKVYAFEPQGRLINLLRRSAFLNGLGALGGAGTIESHEVGVSDRNGTMGFFVPDGHLGGGHMTKTEVGDGVPVVRLDDLLGPDFRCDLVKIDVEGHELPALRGMEKILANSSCVRILFEKLGRDHGYEKEIEDFLGKLNFKLYGVAANAILVPLKSGDLAHWDGYALAAKVGDPELEELESTPNSSSIPAS